MRAMEAVLAYRKSAKNAFILNPKLYFDIQSEGNLKLFYLCVDPP